MQPLARRQAGELVLRRQLCHRHRPRGQGGDALFREITRGDEGDALADEDAQAHIAGFGAFHVFQSAQAIGNAGRDVFDEQGVGGIGAGGLSGADQVMQEVLRIGFGCHGSYLARRPPERKPLRTQAAEA